MSQHAAFAGSYSRGLPRRDTLAAADWDSAGACLVEALVEKVFIDGKADIQGPGGALPGCLYIYYPQNEVLFLLRKCHFDSRLMPFDARLATVLAAMRGWKVACLGGMTILYNHMANPSSGISTKEIRRRVSENNGNL